MEKSIIRTKSYKLALESLKIADLLKESREFSLADQILRSGTSVGAMVYESKYAESKKDFIHKLNIGLKEAHETKYWISILKDSGKLSKEISNSYLNLVEEVLRILNSIIVTTRKNLKNS